MQSNQHYGMKKPFYFVLFAIVGVIFSGCSKDYHDEYITYGAQVLTQEYTINPADWSLLNGENLPGAGNYLYVEFENHDITADVIKNGAVTADVYAIYDVQKNLGAWNPLPYVIPVEFNVTNSDGSPAIQIVPENLRMEWEQGLVTFVIQDLDGYNPEDMASTIYIRVTVIKNYQQ